VAVLSFVTLVPPNVTDTTDSEVLGLAAMTAPPTYATIVDKRPPGLHEAPVFVREMVLHARDVVPMIVVSSSGFSWTASTRAVVASRGTRGRRALLFYIANPSCFNRRATCASPLVKSFDRSGPRFGCW